MYNLHATINRRLFYPSRLVFVNKYSVKANTLFEKVSLKKISKGYGLTINGRQLETPSQIPVYVPSRAIGELLMAEWRNSVVIPNEKPAPLTSLVFRALELEADLSLNASVVDDLASYLHTDSICYIDPNPETSPILRDCWYPIVSSIQKAGYLGDIIMSETISPIRQPQSTLVASRNYIISQISLSSFILAGFEQLVRNFKSFLLPYALHSQLIDIDQAFRAGSLESELQIKKWGSIDDHHILQRSQLWRNTCLGYLLLTS